MSAISFQHVCKTYSSPQKKKTITAVRLPQAMSALTFRLAKFFWFYSVPMALARP
jgi:hypothetical protein